MQAIKERYIALDSWRGIAAICVALMHLEFYSNLYELAFIRNAFLFVDFFFVLSGFVITHTYYRSIRSLAGLSLFIVKRFARLWPLHFFTMMMVIFLMLLKELVSQHFSVSVNSGVFAQGAREIFVSILSNLILIHDIFPLYYNHFNGPSWSISVEFFAYVVFALITLRFKRNQQFVWFAVGLIGAIVIFNGSSRFMENQELGIFRCLYGFFLGCITYHLRNWPLRSTTSIEFLAVAFIYLIICRSGFEAMNMLSPFVFAFAIFVFAQERGKISVLLKARLFCILGTLSYSIYLTHFFFILLIRYGATVIERVLHHDVRTMHGILVLNQWVMDFFTLLFLAIIVGFSSLTYKYIEVPWKSRIISTTTRPRGIVRDD